MSNWKLALNSIAITISSSVISVRFGSVQLNWSTEPNPIIICAHNWHGMACMSCYVVKWSVSIHWQQFRAHNLLLWALAQPTFFSSNSLSLILFRFFIIYRHMVFFGNSTCTSGFDASITIARIDIFKVQHMNTVQSWCCCCCFFSPGLVSVFMLMVFILLFGMMRKIKSTYICIHSHDVSDQAKEAKQMKRASSSRKQEQQPSGQETDEEN